MRFMLDTNICIYAMKHKPRSVVDRLLRVSPDDIAISVITAGELWYGAKKSARPDHNRKSIDTFLTEFRLLPFSEKAADEYAAIRADLERQGHVIGELDMMIAGHARGVGLTLVTNNAREFDRVGSLRVENWV